MKINIIYRQGIDLYLEKRCTPKGARNPIVYLNSGYIRSLFLSKASQRNDVKDRLRINILHMKKRPLPPADR